MTWAGGAYSVGGTVDWKHVHPCVCASCRVWAVLSAVRVCCCGARDGSLEGFGARLLANLCPRKRDKISGKSTFDENRRGAGVFGHD